MAAATSAADVSPCTRTGHTRTRRGKSVFEAVENVADHRAGRRGDDADDFRQERQQLLARLVEQAFGGELLLALLEQLHQRADAGRLETVDHDLVFGRAGKGRQLAGYDDVEAFLGPDAHPPERALPDHRLQHSLVVLEAEIDMAGGRRSFESRHLAAHADIAIGVLDRAPERRGQLRHGPFHNVIEGGLCHSGRISCEGETPCYTKRRPSSKGRLRVP